MEIKTTLLGKTAKLNKAKFGTSNPLALEETKELKNNEQSKETIPYIEGKDRQDYLSDMKYVI